MKYIIILIIAVLLLGCVEKPGEKLETPTPEKTPTPAVTAEVSQTPPPTEAVSDSDTAALDSLSSDLEGEEISVSEVTTVT